jgi:AcrR family transcriptional regulator
MERRPEIIADEQASAHDQRRAEILAQSRHVLRDTGELSLAQVARELDIQPPSLYEYFPGKLAIYDALYVMAFREFESYVRPAFERADALWDAVGAGIESYMRFAWQNPALFSIGFQRPPPGFEPSEVSVAIRDVILQRVRGSVLQYMQAAELDLDISQEEAINLLAAVGHGLVVQGVMTADQHSGDWDRIRRLASALIDPLRAAWQVDPEGKPELNAWGLPI